MSLPKRDKDSYITASSETTDENKAVPSLPVLRYRYLDQRRYHTPAALLDCVAHMLLYLDQPDIMMEVALAYLVRSLNACRGDAGVANPNSLFYIPSAVYLSPPSDAPTMLGVKVPNKHPALQLVWRTAAPVRIEQVEVNLMLGNLREAFIGLRSRSMVARRLEHEAAILGLICIDHTEESHEWQPKELELIELVCQEYLAPLLEYSLRLYQQNHKTNAANLLTPAELEVIKLAANGLTYNQIAQTLGKSVHTVDKQLRNAREKIGARNQSELIRLTTHLL